MGKTFVSIFSENIKEEEERWKFVGTSEPHENFLKKLKKFPGKYFSRKLV